MTASLDGVRAREAVGRIKEHLSVFPEDPREFWRGYCLAVHGLAFEIRRHGLARALATSLAASGSNNKASDNNARNCGRLAALKDIAVGLNGWLNKVPDTTTSESFRVAIKTFCETEDSDYNNLRTKAKEAIEQLVDLNFETHGLVQHEVVESIAWLKNLSAPYKPKESEGDKAVAESEGGEIGTLAQEQQQDEETPADEAGGSEA